MTTQDLQDLIRDELADEPPFRLTSAGVLDAGRRQVRRRRLVGAAVSGLAAVAVVAGVAWVGVPSAPEAGRTGTGIPPAAQQVLDDFDPAAFPGIIDTVVRGAAGSALPADVVGRIEPTLDGYTRLRPDDYAYTDAWTAWYDLAPDDQLMVVLRHDQSANEGSARKYCAESVDDGSMERCSVDALPDGSIAITSVSELSRKRTGFTLAADDPDSRWYARQVVNRRSYGFGVIAREYVKAPTLAEADAQWSLPTGRLTEIVSSPRLVYRMPDQPKRDCNTTFLMPRTETGYARVVCERSLDH